MQVTKNDENALEVNGKPMLSKSQQKILNSQRKRAEIVQKKLLEFTNRFVQFLIDTNELSHGLVEMKIAQRDKQWRLYLYNQGIVSPDSATLCAYNCGIIYEKFEAKMQDAPPQPTDIVKQEALKDEAGED